MTALVEAIQRHIGPWTLDEFVALGELPAWPRLELIEGSLLLSPHATVGHQRVCMNLSLLFAEPSRRARLEVLSPANVSLPAQVSMPIPDIVVAHYRAFGKQDDLAVDAEDVALLVEVESPSTRGRDRLLKPDLYARGGLAHYWRVELAPGHGPVVYRYALHGDAYRLLGRTPAGEQLVATEPFPVQFDPADLITTPREEDPVPL